MGVRETAAGSLKETVGFAELAVAGVADVVPPWMRRGRWLRHR